MEEQLQMNLPPTLPPSRLPRALALSPRRFALLLVATAALAGCATAPGTDGDSLTVLGKPQGDSGESPAAAATPSAVPAAPASSVQAATAVVKGPEVITVAIDPLQPTERLDLDAATTKIDLWARVRQGMSMPELDNELVRKWEQWYAGRPDYVARMTERGGRYLFHTVEEVSKRGMPTELALLPFIESAYNPQAMSAAKASGMWQFVPATGRDFSLKQNIFRDDRRDVLASTRAALDYLQVLHSMFGDWQLALAAYNWGQGNVQRAISRNQKAGLPTDYDSLKMPDETRNYLPKLQAVKNIVLRPEAFALGLPTLRNHPYFVSVAIDRDIDLDLAARLAGLPLDEFKQLNPQMNKPVILAAGTPQVLLPFDAAGQFVHAIGQHHGTQASWTAWVAPRTMKPAAVARLLGMPEAQLCELNNIPKGMLVKAGSTLLVPRSAQFTADVAEHIAENAMLALSPDLPPLRRVSFAAGKKGDSVAAVARRYRVSVTQVAAWNSTSSTARFKPGQRVVVMVPNRSTQPSVRLAGDSAAANAKSVRKGGSVKRISRPGPTARTRAAQN
jgi:membrane-bound lytic murein transglycosylase D